jgi:hypothetical protein
MNRTKNEDFNKLQTNVRHGIWDTETAQAFKSRELAPLTPAASASSLDGPEADYVPILVTRNRTRAALEFAHLRAISESAKTDLDLPIIIFAHMKTKRGARAITASEKAYLLGLPDSEFNKAAPNLALYPGARRMLTDNLNVDCGIGQGVRCRALCFPEFPPNNSFSIISFNGVRVRTSSALPLFLFVELTSTRLLAIPRGQPLNLPPNVIALPLHLHKKACVSLSGLHDASRKSVTLRLKQLPLRPANALTSYSVQSGQFKQIIIYETKPNEFYTQISRCTSGLSSISLARPLPPRFKPTANANTIAEVARLEALHIVTNRNFDAEVSMPVGRVDVVPVSLPAVTAASVGDTSQPPTAPPQTGLDLHPDQSVANCSSSSAFGVTGLVNLGNTCYINTIIQCFLSLHQIRNYYISDLFLQNLKPTGKTKR